jgi:alkylhydroperoxidase family enzyme
VASKLVGEDTVDAVLNNLERARIGEPLRATLRFLRKITREHENVTADDVRPLLSLGVTRDQIEEALDVAFAFNVITRLADTFNFEVGSRASFDAGAKMLLTRGYR